MSRRHTEVSQYMGQAVFDIELSGLGVNACVQHHAEHVRGKAILQYCMHSGMTFARTSQSLCFCNRLQCCERWMQAQFQAEMACLPVDFCCLAHFIDHLIL